MPDIPGSTVTGDQTGNVQTPEKMFTQSELNELMRKRVERSHNAFFKRYGVADLEELDNLVAQAQGYEATKQLYDEAQAQYATEKQEAEARYADLETQHKDLTKRYAYKVGNVNPEKFTDIETYFKGKGIDIDETTLSEELKTHPDWITKRGTISNLGSEAAQNQNVDEAVLASEIFGVDLTK